MEREDVVEVIEVKRLDDRICRRKIVHVFSVYAPKLGKPEKEKREFLEKLSDNNYT